MAIRTQSELYEEFIAEVQSQDPTWTDDSEGSKLDVIAGACTTAVAEVTKVSVDEFRKTFIDTAAGPEETGDTDELERLLVDHFGPEFERPEATKAVGVVTFSRENDDEGDVEILAGTIVKTAQNAAGSVQRFEVIASVTLTGLSINASVQALVEGPSGNVIEEAISEIETALTDPSVTVSNEEEFSGGANALTDAEYRQYARNLLRTLSSGNIDAIEAAAKTVAGVVFATGREFVKFVKEWDIANDSGIGDYFRISYPVLYIGDANGNASAPLIAAVKTAVSFVRAGGVEVWVFGFTTFSLNWTGQITLDSGGPNFAALSEDPQPIIDTMTQYLQNLQVGESFDKEAADTYILSQWGPEGSGDLQEGGFVTQVPSGNVAVNNNQKIIPGTVGLA